MIGLLCDAFLAFLKKFSGSPWDVLAPNRLADIEADIDSFDPFDSRLPAPPRPVEDAWPAGAGESASAASPGGHPHWILPPRD